MVIHNFYGSNYKIAHVRYIKILTWLWGFKGIYNCKSLKTPFSQLQKRLEHWENQNKHWKMTRKPRNHVRILMYRSFVTFSKFRKLSSFLDDFFLVKRSFYVLKSVSRRSNDFSFVLGWISFYPPTDMLNCSNYCNLRWPFSKIHFDYFTLYKMFTLISISFV